MPYRITAMFVAVTMFASVALAGGGRNIHECARNGELREVRQYVERDASLVHSKDDQGYTPLHWAADWGQEDVVEYLLSKGADPLAAGPGGWTPLQAAEREDHKKVARMLRAAIEERKNNPPAAAAPATPAVTSTPQFPQPTQTQMQFPQQQTTQFPQQTTQFPQQTQQFPQQGAVPGMVPQMAPQSTFIQPPMMTGDPTSNVMAAKQYYDQVKMQHDQVAMQYQQLAAQLQQAQAMLQQTYATYQQQQQMQAMQQQQQQQMQLQQQQQFQQQQQQQTQQQQQSGNGISNTAQTISEVSNLIQTLRSNH